MPSPSEAEGWAKFILAYGPMLTDLHFLSLQIAGWLIALAIWRAWLGRRITNAESAAKLADRETQGWKTRYETERDQHAALREWLGEKHPEIDWFAVELHQGRPDVREALAPMLSGQPIPTDANPDNPRAWITVPIGDFSKMSALAYANSSGFSASTITHVSGPFFIPQYTTTAPSEAVAIVNDALDKLREEDGKT